MFKVFFTFICFCLTLTACTKSQVCPSSLPPCRVKDVGNGTPLPPMPKEMIYGLGQKKTNDADRALIIIDPGHGGDDYGAQSLSKPTYYEKNLNLATAKILSAFLKQLGFSTVMTRSDDTFIPLDQRAIFANEKKGKLFVSVHYNSAPSKEADGIEVFFYKTDQDKKRVQASRLLARNVLDKTIANTQAKSRGVKHGDFAVIRLTNMPAILIEGGFLTNDDEMLKLKDPVYIKKLAWGIAQGIAAYYEQS